MDKTAIEKINSELKKRIAKLLPNDGHTQTKIGGLYVFRASVAGRCEKCMYSPKIILMVQGCKRAITETGETTYRENQCLVSGIDVPGTSYVLEASREKPILTVSLELDTKLISQMLAEMPLEKIRGERIRNGLAVADADEDLMDAFLRLMKLLDKNNHIAVIAPIVIREIYSRILISPMGMHVRQLCTLGTQSNQITKAVDWLKSNFRKPFKIEELAEYVHMAPTTFHRHFRKITSVSPIQYQKNLRLYEARRLMISDNETVANAAFAVGYESPTQFSREYKRHFGVPPKRDIAV